MHSLQSTDFQRASSILSYFFCSLEKRNASQEVFHLGWKLFRIFQMSAGHLRTLFLTNCINLVREFSIVSLVFATKMWNALNFVIWYVFGMKCCVFLCLIVWMSVIWDSWAASKSSKNLNDLLDFFYIFSFSFSLQFILFILDFFLMQCIPNAVVRVIFLPEWLWFHALLFLSINFRWIALNWE